MAVKLPVHLKVDIMIKERTNKRIKTNKKPETMDEHLEHILSLGSESERVNYLRNSQLSLQEKKELIKRILEKTRPQPTITEKVKQLIAEVDERGLPKYTFLEIAKLIGKSSTFVRMNSGLDDRQLSERAQSMYTKTKDNKTYNHKIREDTLKRIIELGSNPKLTLTQIEHQLKEEGIDINLTTIIKYLRIYKIRGPAKESSPRT